MNFTIGDSSLGGGTVGDVGLYGTTSGTIGTAVNSHVGLSYSEGLVGNALLNHPLYKLAGTSSLTHREALQVKVKFQAVDTRCRPRWWSSNSTINGYCNLGSI